MIFINADDLGYNNNVSDRILVCYEMEKIHTASLMTFMKDSERAADLSVEKKLPVGLHLNFDQKLTGERFPNELKEHHQSTAAYLKARKWNQVLYNPFLDVSFDYVFQAQWDEFCRLFGEVPKRVDGHHHMHLCMNMIFSGNYPKGLKVRRNFSFSVGEKDPINRFYRYLVDRWLTSRFQCTDYFFSMAPIDQDRIKRLVSLSKHSDVEMMVHPGMDEEYQYLLSDEWAKLLAQSKAADTLNN